MVRNTLAEVKPQSSAETPEYTLNHNPPKTRIQRKNRETILDAALDVFSTDGFRGATLDQIASRADLSKPNLLYYFPSKEAIYTALLSELLEAWLDPLHAITGLRDPVDEITDYVRLKLQMSREFPRESRLFANEIVQGAPRIIAEIEGPLKTLVDDKAELFQRWIKDGKIAEVDPYHLIFSIWATTQHYADFSVQVQGILQSEGDAHFADAETFLVNLYASLLKPGTS